MKHILLKDTSLEGKEYGTLRSFEAAIIEETNASVVEIPVQLLPPGCKKYFGHGMDRGAYRKYFPKKTFTLASDTLWYVLMGPENYQLDLFKGWPAGAKTKILYLFDTLPSQYPLIERLFSNNTWDIMITSFNDAVDDLQKLTGRKWYSLEQAADASFFKQVPISERLIHFSAYGRRHPVVHELVKEFCSKNDFYYDYTMTEVWNKQLTSSDLYRQYSWHLNHSVFTFSWPVEITNPQRAAHLHPITCRWFEAAAAGTVIVGKQPANPVFNNLLFENAVQEMKVTEAPEDIFKQLESLWHNRQSLLQNAGAIQLKNREKWSWNERVKRVLSWI